MYWLFITGNQPLKAFCSEAVRALVCPCPYTNWTLFYKPLVGTKMNWLNFEVSGSEDKVIARPNIVRKTLWVMGSNVNKPDNHGRINHSGGPIPTYGGGPFLIRVPRILSCRVHFFFSKKLVTFI